MVSPRYDSAPALHLYQLVTVQGSMMVRPAALNALVSREATANPCAADCGNVAIGRGKVRPSRLLCDGHVYKESVNGARRMITDSLYT